jgi:hypothetical protein
MLGRIALVGLAILVVGLIVGSVGAASPVQYWGSPTVNLITTSLRIDPNGYASQNTVLKQGQPFSMKVSITNVTVFFFYVMNQTQYAPASSKNGFYACAPTCHPPLGSLNDSGRQPAFINQTVTLSTSYSANFTAPADGTYYFVFDNSVGPNWASYVGTNASGFTTGSFTLTTQSVDSSVNWGLVGTGAALLVIGGAVATVMWEGTKKP